MLRQSINEHGRQYSYSLGRLRACTYILPAMEPPYSSVDGPSAKMNGRSSETKHDGASVWSAQKIVYVVAAVS